MIKNMTTTFITTNGIAALQTSDIVVPDGATPFITNKPKPNGGVKSPVSRLIRSSRQYKMGLTPRVSMIGINVGMVIIKMESPSRKQPRNSTITIIIEITA